MNWLAFILCFSISVLVAAFLGKLLVANRPGWTRRRRKWTAVLVMPLFIGVLTLAGLGWVIWTGPGTGENMQDLGLIVTAIAGAIFAAIALAGGLVGAKYAEPQP